MKNTLLAAIFALLTLVTASCLSAETQCERDGGQVKVHTFTGNVWCDYPPYADKVSDFAGRDRLIR